MRTHGSLRHWSAGALDGVRRLEHAIDTAVIDVAVISAAIVDLDEQAAAQGSAIGPDGAVRDVTAAPVFERPSSASASFSLRTRHQQAIASSPTRSTRRRA